LCRICKRVFGETSRPDTANVERTAGEGRRTANGRELRLKWYERATPAERVDYRNGFYERDYMTPLGVICLRHPGEGRRRDESPVKAQKIYLPNNIAAAQKAFERVCHLAVHIVW
jgi:hypothetical protein